MDRKGQGILYVVHMACFAHCIEPFHVGVSESDLIYHSLFIVAQVFQVVLCVDALHSRNTGSIVSLYVIHILVNNYV